MDPAVNRLFDSIIRTIRPRRQIDDGWIGELRGTLLTDSELRRMPATVGLIPRAERPGARLIDIGASIFWLPLYLYLGYRHITAVVRPGHGNFDEFQVSWKEGFKLDIVEANAELDTYPIDSESANCVVCFDLLEHFAGDPMHCIAESNRILAAGGLLCLTTPNVLCHQNVLKILLGKHPSSWSVYTCNFADRHNWEYTPFEVQCMLDAGGFAVQRVSTVTYKDRSWRRRLIGRILCVPSALAGRVSFALRGELMLACGRKAGPVKTRYPEFLYNLYGRSAVTSYTKSGSANSAVAKSVASTILTDEVS
jgi:SAM-dependent methyltransferase